MARRILAAALVLVLAGVLLSGCGGGKPATSEGGDAQAPSAAPAVSPDPENPGKSGAAETGEAAETDQRLASGNEWPEELLPPGLPEFKEGTFKSWQWADDDKLLMEFTDISKDALAQYLDQLQAEGWALQQFGDSSWAFKGLYQLDFDLSASPALQVSVRTRKEGTWPRSSRRTSCSTGSRRPRCSLGCSSG